MSGKGEVRYDSRKVLGGDFSNLRVFIAEARCWVCKPTMELKLEEEPNEVGVGADGVILSRKSMSRGEGRALVGVILVVETFVVFWKIRKREERREIEMSGVGGRKGEGRRGTIMFW